MTTWSEKKLQGMKFIRLINDEVLQENHYYVTSIVEIEKSLTANELPIQGTCNIQEHENTKNKVCSKVIWIYNEKIK